MPDDKKILSYDIMTGKPIYAEPEVKADNPYAVPTAYSSPDRVSVSATAVVSEPKTEPFKGRYAGLFVRLAAYLIDAVVASVCAGLLRGLLTLLPGSDVNLLFSYTLPDIIGYLVFTAYFVLLTKLCSTTLGKKLFRLRVVSADSAPLSWLTVIFRETVGKYLNSLLLAGCVVLAVDEKKRGIHDLLCDTLVVYNM